MQIQLEEGRDIMQILNMQQNQIDSIQSFFEEIQQQLDQHSQTFTTIIKEIPQVQDAIQRSLSLEQIAQKQQEYNKFISDYLSLNSEDYAIQLNQLSEINLKSMFEFTSNKIKDLKNTLQLYLEDIEEKQKVYNQRKVDMSYQFQTFQECKDQQISLEREIAKKKREFYQLQEKDKSHQQRESEIYHAQVRSVNLAQQQKEMQQIEEMKNQNEIEIGQLQGKILELQPQINVVKSELTTAKTILLKKQKTVFEEEAEDVKHEKTQRYLMYSIMLLVFIFAVTFIMKFIPKDFFPTYLLSSSQK